MRHKLVRLAGDLHSTALVTFLTAGLFPTRLFQTLRGRLAVTVAGRRLGAVAAVLVVFVQLLQKLVDSLCQSGDLCVGSCNLIQQFRILLCQR